MTFDGTCERGGAQRAPQGIGSSAVLLCYITPFNAKCVPCSISPLPRFFANPACTVHIHGHCRQKSTLHLKGTHVPLVAGSALRNLALLAWSPAGRSELEIDSLSGLRHCEAGRHVGWLCTPYILWPCDVACFRVSRSRCGSRFGKFAETGAHIFSRTTGLWPWIPAR
jgi:hypothetical protein